MQTAPHAFFSVPVWAVWVWVDNERAYVSFKPGALTQVGFYRSVKYSPNSCKSFSALLIKFSYYLSQLLGMELGALPPERMQISRLSSCLASADNLIIPISSY